MTSANIRHHPGVSCTILALLCVAGCAPNKISVQEAAEPFISSMPPTNGSVGYFYIYSPAATGEPVPSMTVAGLPAWLQWSNRRIIGTPTVDDLGEHGPIVITAENGVGKAASQSFSIIVTGAPQITRAPPTTATVGQAYAYDIATTGFPAASLSVVGAPDWLTLTGSTLAGTPAAADAGPVLPLFIVATNGTQPDAQQEVNIEVSMAPTITSRAPSTATADHSYVYSVETTGYPAPSLSLLGAPSWLSLNGTALQGSPTASDAGMTPLFTVSADNGTAPPATETISIDVSAAPSIESIPVLTVRIGTDLSYPLVAVGDPSPTLSIREGPAWITLQAGRLVASPGSPQVGSHLLEIQADNGIAPKALSRVIVQVRSDPLLLGTSSDFWEAKYQGSSIIRTGFSAPWGLVFDSQKTMYISDSGQRMLFAVDTHGIIRREVALPGNLRPHGLAVDSIDRIYMAESFGHAVRRWTPGGSLELLAGGSDSGYAGDGLPADDAAVRLNSPKGIAWYAGQVYIADSNNHAIRRIDGLGNIETIAGGNESGYAGDGNAAVNAQLSTPMDVHVDTSGVVYIADWGNHAIRMVDTQGDIHTVAGGNGGGYSGDGGPAASAKLREPVSVVTFEDALFITDRANNVIRVVTPRGIIVSYSAGGGDSGAGRVHTCDYATSVIAEPIGITVDSKGRPYVTSEIQDAVYGPFGQNDTRTISTVAQDSDWAPAGMTTDAFDTIYFADHDNHAIRTMDTSGTTTVIAGGNGPGFSGDGARAAAAMLNSPRDVLSVAGEIYLTDSANNAVRKIDASGDIQLVAGGNGLGCTGNGADATAAVVGTPVGLARDSAGNIYFSDVYCHAVWMLDGSDKITIYAGGNGIGPASSTPALATDAYLNLPSGLAFDNDDTLYIADTGNDVIQTVAATDKVMVQTFGRGIWGYAGDGGPNSGAVLFAPTEVILQGDIAYVIDSGNHAIRRFHLIEDLVTTMVGGWSIGSCGDAGPARAAQLATPTAGVIIGTTLYFSDTGRGSIRSVPLN